MKSNLFLQVIIFCFAFFCAPSVQASSLERQEVIEWAEQRGNELLQALSYNNLEVKYQALDNLFSRYVDTDYIAKFVMGKYWPIMTADEQLQFRRMFKLYALAIYKTYPLTLTDKVSFQIIRAVITGPNTAEVYAQIHFASLPQQDALQDIMVQFNIRESASGLKLVDLKIAESSLAVTYRRKFYQLMQEDDGEVSWFLEDFQQIIDSVERRNADYVNNGGAYSPNT